ncbi:MAG TPA: LacI family DNA-binding transcriptional regulator [Streptosporangiaceae bacterium]|nr:LacI family DNA-binding transcriptional regulator [Streptosporangiaceae bacterium]
MLIASLRAYDGPLSPGSSSPAGGQQPTIYDVARAAGVSIASVSRVLNGHRNPRQETRDRVLAAVHELGFVPDGAARALSGRLKEVVGVVFRRVPWSESADGMIAITEEDESLQFTDVINRGIEVAAQRRGFNLIIGSVDVEGHDAHRRVMMMARKCDGLILHDQVLEPPRLAQLSRQVPVVTMAGVATQTTANVRSDNGTGMTELARHLIRDHGYQTLAYLAGHADSPDNLARRLALAEAAASAGVRFVEGPRWQGNYLASGGVRAMRSLLMAKAELPHAIVCANDQTALGVIHELARHGIDVPGDVAVTGFDDIPLARHLRPRLTTVRQPIQDLGATAFEVLRSMIAARARDGHVAAERDVVLATTIVRRESCGCQPDGSQDSIPDHPATGR